MTATTHETIEAWVERYFSSDFDTRYTAYDKLREAEEDFRIAFYAEARPRMEKQLRQAVASGDAAKVIDALEATAQLAHDVKNFAAARSLIEEELYWRRKFQRLHSSTLLSAGWILQKQGDLKAARVYMEEAVELARTERPLFEDLVARSLFGLGSVCAAQGKLEEARRYFGESLARKQAWRLKSPTHDIDDIEYTLGHICKEYALALLKSKCAEQATQLFAVVHRIALHRNEEPSSIPGFLKAIEKAKTLLGEQRFAAYWQIGISFSSSQIQHTFFPWNEPIKEN